MKYKMEVGVRITDEDDEQTLAQTLVEVDTVSAAEALIRGWTDAGHNLSSFLGLEMKDQLTIMIGMAKGMLFDLIRRGGH